MSKAHLAALALASLVACDAILGLDADYQVTTAGGSAADGGDGGTGAVGGSAVGGTGGTGGELCGQMCGACRECPTGTCSALPYGDMDPACLDADSCDGLGTCHFVDHIGSMAKETVQAIAAAGDTVAMAGVYEGDITVGGETFGAPGMTQFFFYVAAYAIDGPPRGAWSVQYGGTNPADFIRDLSVSPDGTVFMTGVLGGSETVTVNGTELGGAATVGGSYVLRLNSPNTTVPELLVLDAVELTHVVAADMDRLYIVGEFEFNILTLCGADLTNRGSDEDGFAAVYNHDFTSCSWATSWGTSGADTVTTAMLDGAGYLVVGGAFNGTRILTVDGDTTFSIGGGSEEDAYVARIWPSNTANNPDEWGAWLGSGSGTDTLHDLAGTADTIHLTATIAGATPSLSSTAFDPPGSTSCNVLLTSLDARTGVSLAHEIFPRSSCTDFIHLDLALTANGVALGGTLENWFDTGERVGAAGDSSVFAVDFNGDLEEGWRRVHTMHPRRDQTRLLAVGAGNEAGETLFLAFSSSTLVTLDDGTELTEPMPLPPLERDDIFVLLYRGTRDPRP